MAISSRLPDRQQLLQVFATIVLMIYSWTMVSFLMTVPFWRNFLRVGEMLTVLAYSLGTNLAESLAALCLPVVLSLALPRSWFRDVFVARGTALSVAGLAVLMPIAYQFQDRNELPLLVRGEWKPALMLVGVGVLVYLAGRFLPLRRLAEALADRATIFLYVWLPLSAVSIIVVLFRSLR